MLLSIVREGLFHAIFVHITEGFRKVKLINNYYQWRIKENLTATKLVNIKKDMYHNIQVSYLF